MIRAEISRFLGAAAVSAAALLASGCVPASKFPRLEGAKVPSPEQSTAAAALKSSLGDVSSLRALVRATLRRKDQSDSLRYVILYEHPEKIRVEVLPTQAAYALAVLASDGSEFTFLDVGARTALQGKPGPEMIEKSLGLPCRADELIALLSGRPPASLFEEGAVMVRNESQKSFSLLDRAGRNYWVFDSEQLVPIRAQLLDGRRSVLEMYYDELQSVDGAVLPQRMRALVPRYDLEIQMVLTSAKVNGAIEPERFTVAVPPGFDLERQSR